MKIDYEKVKKTFPEKAWAYAEQYDCVKIGKWEKDKFVFKEELDEDSLILLRVFDGKCELKFSGEKCRNTSIHNGKDFITELEDARYYMYGEKAETTGMYTMLWEDRGGKIDFPAALNFPTKDKAGNEIVALKLGIKHYVRYNDIPVLKEKQEFDYGLDKNYAGALQVVDYAYTGFFYDNGNEVPL